MPETKNSNDPVMIPYFMAESMADRQQLTIKKLWILCILLIVLLVGTNGLWLWYESQFEYYEKVEQDVQTGNGDATVIGIITVPKGCCFSIAVRYVDATTDDPATEPTPLIEVQNSNLVINRIA